MRLRPVALATLTALVGATLATLPTTSAVAACDPGAEPEYSGTVPTGQEVLGFKLGAHATTPQEIRHYIRRVDRASDRVTSGAAATSVVGRTLPYAIVGDPQNVTADALESISRHAQTLRDPTLSPGRVNRLVASTPAILWVAGNVHGNEKSGADAALRILYDLADRTDCSAQKILDNAIVVLLPMQNPDGRVRNIRRNAYAFDMNRDWFARTQPETDGKLELLRQYPPMLFADAHEFGYQNYLFPPHADPEYHETPDTAHDWIFDDYSPAIVNAFRRENLKFHHGPPYDFFASIFGDTVPAVGFGAAGMTFEKDYRDPMRERAFEHYTAMWASIAQGADGGSAYVRQWHQSYVSAYQQGIAGQLDPNGIYNEGNELYQEVPDITVRHYFLLNRRSDQFELETLVRRLQRMDVDVYQLNEPLRVSDFKPYGDPKDGRTLPAGTYWIPMAQGQKHWIQSMLHEDTYIPYKVTYDVTAWSNPLLMNLDGGWSGKVLDPDADLVPAITHEVRWTDDPGKRRIGLYQIPHSTRGWEAAKTTRYLFEQLWHVRYTDVNTRDLKEGLRGVDVLVIPDGYAPYALHAMGGQGKDALRTWVRAGGRLVTWQDGVRVAIASGVSSTEWSKKNAAAPGTLVRTTVDQSSPLAKGVGPRMWVMYYSDNIVRNRHSVATFPSTSSPDYATAGKANRMSWLDGASVVSDEAVGKGRVVSFSIDPNFRAWTLGTDQMLWNAITGPNPRSTGQRVSHEQFAAAAEQARRASRGYPDIGDAVRVAVPASQAATALAALHAAGLDPIATRFGADQQLIVVPNPDDLGLEQSRALSSVLPRLQASGVSVLWASLPGP